MAILGGLCTGQDLTNEVDDGIGTSTKFANDLELVGKVKVGTVGCSGKAYVMTL